MKTRKKFALISSLVTLLFATSLFAQQDAPLPALPELIAYWPLATNAQNSVADTNHGVVIGQALFNDQALVLNGQDSYVNFGSALAIDGSFSMALWACPATNDRLMRVLGRFEVSEGNKDYCVFLNCGNRIWAFFSDNGTADEGHAFLTTSLLPACPEPSRGACPEPGRRACPEPGRRAGEWHHLAMTWDASRSSTGLSLYANGIPLATTNAQISDIQHLHVGQADLTLGAYDVTNALSNPFHGSLSQLMLFSGVLSPDEVQDLSEQGRLGNLMTYLSTYLPDPSTSLRTGAQPNNEGQTVTQNAAASQETTTASSNQVSVLRRPPSVLRPRFIYVDQARGNDACSGRASLILGSDGPKKTVKSGLSAATAGDTLVIKEGNYGEDLNIAGRNMSVRIEGKVNLSGHKPAEITPLPAIPASNVSSNGMGQ